MFQFWATWPAVKIDLAFARSIFIVRDSSVLNSRFCKAKHLADIPPRRPRDYTGIGACGFLPIRFEPFMTNTLAQIYFESLVLTFPLRYGSYLDQLLEKCCGVGKRNSFPLMLALVRLRFQSLRA